MYQLLGQPPVGAVRSGADQASIGAPRVPFRPTAQLQMYTHSTVVFFTGKRPGDQQISLYPNDERSEYVFLDEC